MRAASLSALRCWTSMVSTSANSPTTAWRQSHAISLTADLIYMSEANGNLKERVRAFWQANPCGVKFADAEVGTRLFYERVEEHRYSKEWHIPAAADFAGARGLRVLEIGCGLGKGGAQFARAG